METSVEQFVKSQLQSKVIFNTEGIVKMIIPKRKS